MYDAQTWYMRYLCSDDVCVRFNCQRSRSPSLQDMYTIAQVLGCMMLTFYIQFKKCLLVRC